VEAVMERRTISLKSGLTLSALEGGGGQPLVMIPGWSQSAAEWRANAEALAKGRRVIALDMRGHGESDKPNHGYRISRLAIDLAEALDALGLTSVDLMGHSMGCSVIWSYLDLVSPALVRRLVLVDQAPSVIAKPGWTDDEKSRYGCLFPSAADFGGFVGAVAATSDVDGTMGILKGMFTAGFPEASLRFIASENLKLPRGHAANLLHDHCYLDWRDVIEGIRLPTLVVGAEASIFSAASQRWIASVIPGAEVEIFEAGAGGSHFMFAENAARFDARVAAFLSA
jgi:pimeloyl-ACP methyl ester carboxylesterase